MEEAEVQLLRAKRLRRNAKMALKYHTRTMESALAQEGTTAAEMEDLIVTLTKRTTKLEEAHEALMILTPDEALEQEYINILALYSQLRDAAKTKLNINRSFGAIKLSAPDQGANIERLLQPNQGKSYERKLQQLNLYLKKTGNGSAALLNASNNTEVAPQPLLESNPDSYSLQWSAFNHRVGLPGHHSDQNSPAAYHLVHQTPPESP